MVLTSIDSDLDFDSDPGLTVEQATNSEQTSECSSAASSCEFIPPGACICGLIPPDACAALLERGVHAPREQQGGSRQASGAQSSVGHKAGLGLHSG